MIFTFIALITSNSSTGIIGATIGLIVYFALTLKVQLKNYIQPLIIVGSFALVVIFLNAVSDNRIDSEIASMSDEVQMISGNYTGKDGLITSIDEIPNGLELSTEDFVIRFVIKGNELELQDVHGDKYVYIFEDLQVVFEDAQFENLSIELLESRGGMTVIYRGKTIYMRFLPDGVAMLGPGLNAFPSNLDAPSYGFDGMESFASSRGYIWSRSIPMLKGTFLIGYGPDAYVAAFPHYDLLDTANFLRKTTRLVDKPPHNIYLQIALNTGIVSLLALVVMIVGVLVVLIKKAYIIGVSDQGSLLLMSIATLLIVFAVTGLANDSIVTITSVVWVMIGLGAKGSELT